MGHFDIVVKCESTFLFFKLSTKSNGNNYWSDEAMHG